MGGGGGGGMALQKGSFNKFNHPYRRKALKWKVDVCFKVESGLFLSTRSSKLKCVLGGGGGGGGLGKRGESLWIRYY